MESVFGINSVSLPTPEQKTFNGVSVPLVLVGGEEYKTVDDVVKWVEANEEGLIAETSKHGGILFRGFPLKSAEDFDAFVGAFKSWEELSYRESLSFAVRIQVAGRVFTANEGKKGGQVFHHELAQTPFWPRKLLFFCEIPPDFGGMKNVFERVREKFPQFIKNCEEKRVFYSSTMAVDNDPSRGAGRSWKSFFNVSNKEEAEKRMTELGYTWKWLEGESLKAKTPALEATKTTENGRKVFFNQLVAQYAGNFKEFSAVASEGVSSVSLDDFLVFEDGTSMDVEALEYARQICEETAIEIKWQQGDVALLDNMLVMHARRDYDGNRRVLASLVK